MDYETILHLVKKTDFLRLVCIALMFYLHSKSINKKIDEIINKV